MCGPGFSVGSRSQLIASCPRAIKASRTVPLNSQPIRTLKGLTSYVFRASVQRQGRRVSQPLCALREELGFLPCGIAFVFCFATALLSAVDRGVSVPRGVRGLTSTNARDHPFGAGLRPSSASRCATGLLGMRGLERRAAGLSPASAVEDAAFHEAVAAIDESL